MALETLCICPCCKKILVNKVAFQNPIKMTSHGQLFYLQMQFWSLNVIHNCLFLKQTGEGYQIPRKSYNLLKCSYKTGLQVKLLHLLAPILSVHWLRGKNCDPPLIKEPLTKNLIFFDIFWACGRQFSFHALFCFVRTAESQAVFRPSILNLYFRNTIVFSDQSQQPKYFKYGSLKREVKVAQNYQ